MNRYSNKVIGVAYEIHRVHFILGNWMTNMASIDIGRCDMSVKWDNHPHDPSKSKFVKVNHYRSRYDLQYGALAHTKQQERAPKYY